MSLSRYLVCVIAALTATLTLLWGPALAHFMFLDAIATRAAQLYGAMAGALTALAALSLGVYRLRRPLTLALPLQLALDITVSGAVSALTAWVFMRFDPRVPAIEGLSLLCLQIAFACAAGLLIYGVARARVPAQMPAGTERGTLPSVWGLLIYGTSVLALLTAVLLGFGSAGRAAGARDRTEGEELVHLADLLAAAISQSPDAKATARIMGLLDSDPVARAELRAPADPLPLLDERQYDWQTADSKVVLAVGRRWHVARRTVGDRVLWVHAPAGVHPPVRAPDDTALLLLALLLLIAPVGAGVIGRDLAVSLATMVGELRAMGPAAPANAVARGVPVETNDEVGALAAALNLLCQRFATENARLAEDLAVAESVDRARGQFLAASSQGLKQPLDRIAAHCQVLVAQTELNAAQHEDLVAIRQSTNQLLGHVGDILRLTVIEAGEEAPLQREPVDMATLAREIMQRHAFAAGVQTSVRCAPNLPIIQGDRHRLRQVVSNLVSNAAKFTRQGSVRLTVAPDGPGLRLEVIDSGPGIPPAELDRIFEEFHRVEAQREVSGTGLGLAISRRIVERHGGRLWAESQLGEGSTFILCLPKGAA